VNSNNILTTQYLNAGISRWRENPKWDQDFHNSLYKDLHRIKSRGLNQDWWRKIVDHLWNWRAIRPYTKEYISQRGIACLSDFQEEYTAILDANQSAEPSLETISWEKLSGLFGIAAGIKDTMPFSPVFASKLCHFVFPGAFPVVDRAMVGISSKYVDHWHYCREQWVEGALREDLILILKNEIRGGVFVSYPWSTKIVELCVIGKQVVHG
jgi:hypothetical protein